MTKIKKRSVEKPLKGEEALKAIEMKRQETEEILHNIPRGKNKSGRVWKTLRTERYSEIRKVKSLKSSWEKKMQEKAERKSIKDYEKQLKAAKDQEKESLRQRRELNKKRRLENERKSEVVQTIKNTAKIKRMKKKQLRKLEKR